MKKQTYRTIGAIFLGFTWVVLLKMYLGDVAETSYIALYVALVPAIIFSGIAYFKKEDPPHPSNTSEDTSDNQT